MDFVKDIRVGQEGAEAGLGTKVDRPASILGAREVCRISVAKDPSAESDKALAVFGCKDSGIQKNHIAQASVLAAVPAA